MLTGSTVGPRADVRHTPLQPPRTTALPVEGQEVAVVSRARSRSSGSRRSSRGQRGETVPCPSPAAAAQGRVSGRLRLATAIRRPRATSAAGTPLTTWVFEWGVHHNCQGGATPRQLRVRRGGASTPWTGGSVDGIRGGKGVTSSFEELSCTMSYSTQLLDIVLCAATVI